MISRCGLMQKKDGMGMEEFKDYWLNVHGPIASKMANLAQVRPARRSRCRASPMPSDRVRWLSTDIPSCNSTVTATWSRAWSRCTAKERTMSRCSPTPIAKFSCWPSAKSFGSRSTCAAGSSSSACRFSVAPTALLPSNSSKNWWNVHDRLVQTVPGCVGYNQDLVIDRIDGGVSVPYEELPVEGVVEMWFETKEAFDEYYASPEFARASAHSSEFIGAINTYLTETYPVALPSA